MVVEVDCCPSDLGENLLVSVFTNSLYAAQFFTGSSFDNWVTYEQYVMRSNSWSNNLLSVYRRI